MANLDSKDHQTPQKFSSFLMEIYHIWITEKPAQYAAALAYYAIFSFVPVIYIVFTLADFIGSRHSFSEWFYQGISDVLGAQIVSYVEKAVASLAERTTGGTTIISIIGVIGMLFTASLIFYQLQHVLHTIWHVELPTKNITSMAIRNRFFSLIMLLGMFLLFILTTIVSLLVSSIEKFLDMSVVESFISFIAVAALAAFSTALIYKLLPNVQVSWKATFIGASVAGLAVALIIELLSSYFLRSRFTSAIDAAGSMTLLLIGFYFLGQIFIFGAIVTRVYAKMYDKGITSKANLSKTV